MKRQIIALVSVLSLTSPMAFAKQAKIISIDTLVLMQNSQAGKNVARQMREEVEKFQKYVESKKKSLAELETELREKSELLNRDVLETKQGELAAKTKAAEREFAAKEDELRDTIQSAKKKLDTRIQGVVATYAKEHGAEVVVDKNTPGIVFVDPAIDRTSEVLKEFDAEYAKLNQPAPASTAKDAIKPVKEIKKA